MNEIDKVRLAVAIAATRDQWFGGDRDSWWLAEPEGMASDIAEAYEMLPSEDRSAVGSAVGPDDSESA